MALLAENTARLHVTNLTAVEGLAPAACENLPAPTHVFIGGSSGQMEALLTMIWEKNPKARIVATAVALETLGELARCAMAARACASPLPTQGRQDPTH